MDAVVVAAVVAAMATILVGFGGAWLGKRWGLPGLGREVQTQQAALIATLQAEIAELRAQRAEDERRLSDMERCSEELVRMEHRLRRAESEVLDLYRTLGTHPPPERKGG